LRRNATMANPTSAFFNAGPSLVPSPVTATTSLFSVRLLSIIAFTSTYLSCGEDRAITRSFGHTLSTNSWVTFHRYLKQTHVAFKKLSKKYFIYINCAKRTFLTRIKHSIFRRLRKISPIIRYRFIWSTPDQSVELLSFKYEVVIVGRQYATLCCNRTSCVNIISGYHSNCNACTLTFPNGVWNLGNIGLNANKSK